LIENKALGDYIPVEIADYLYRVVKVGRVALFGVLEGRDIDYPDSPVDHRSHPAVVAFVNGLHIIVISGRSGR